MGSGPVPSLLVSRGPRFVAGAATTIAPSVAETIRGFVCVRGVARVSSVCGSVGLVRSVGVGLFRDWIPLVAKKPDSMIRWVEGRRRRRWLVHGNKNAVVLCGLGGLFSVPLRFDSG